MYHVLLRYEADDLLRAGAFLNIVAKEIPFREIEGNAEGPVVGDLAVLHLDVSDAVEAHV